MLTTRSILDVGGLPIHTAVSTDARRIASVTSSDGGVKVWNATGSLLLSLTRSTAKSGEGGAFRALAFSAGGDRLAYATANLDREHLRRSGTGGLTVWDSQGKEVFNLDEQELDCAGVALSGDGQRVAAKLGRGSMDPMARREFVRIWDVATGRKLMETEPNLVGGLALDHEGRHLAALATKPGQSPRIIVWDVTTGTECAGWDAPECIGIDLAFSRDGQRLAATIARYHGPSELVVYDVATREIRQFGQAQSRPTFSTAGTRIAAYITSPRETAKVGLWDIATGRQLLVLEGHTGSSGEGGIAFDTSDERILSTAHLASANAVEVKIWNATPLPGPSAANQTARR